MTKEDMLKNYILTKYRSVREFTTKYDIPYSTVATIFKRGIDNSSINNVIKICAALNISTDALIEGKIIPVSKEDHDIVQIQDILNTAKKNLLSNSNLYIDEKKATTSDIAFFISGIDSLIEMKKNHDNQIERLNSYAKRMMNNEKTN